MGGLEIVVVDDDPILSNNILNVLTLLLESITANQRWLALTFSISSSVSKSSMKDDFGW